jgi:intracellular sulfur oxidation DsrE/DsrF family protein
MKRLILVASLVLVSFGFTYRKPEPYRVAFDLTSRDSVDQTAVVRWIREITAASPNAQLEVVMYGKGLDLVMPERSIVSADVEHAIQNPNVTFKVCAIAMKNNKIEKSQLFPGVQIVPDGIYELISKQQEHWGYIKVSVSR